MKKVLFCINSLEIGGAEKVLVQLLKTIKKYSNEYDIQVVTNIKSDNFLVDEIKKVAKYTYLLKNKKCIMGSIVKRIKFFFLIKENDIIVDFLDGDFYKYTRNLKNKKKIVWLHSSYESLKNRKRDIEKKIKSYDETVVICKEIEEEIKNIGLKKVKVIYNPFSFEDVLKKSTEEFTMKESKFLRDRFYITVCRLNENEKDVKTLLKAFSLYKGKNKLVILGDGPDRKLLEKYSEELKINERVIFVGMVENPYKWIKKSEGLILSSKFEGLPTVLLESLILNKRTISSLCKTGPNEILNFGEFGELFEIGDYNQLALILNSELKNCEKDLKLKSHLEKFNEKNIVKEIMEVLS